MRALILLYSLLIGTHTAQSNSLVDKQSDQDPRRPRSVYVEYGGPSAIYSITYDTRLAPTNNGWGLRAGAGFLPSQWTNRFSLPIQVNYLVGNTRHFLEIGAGATFFHGDLSGSWFSSPDEGSLVLGTLSTGYRYQPLRRGLTARIGVTGLAGSFNNSIAVLPHVSVGYRF